MLKGSLLGRILPPLAGVGLLITLVVLIVGVTYMRSAVLERAQLRARSLSAVERDSLERLMRAGDHADLQRLAEQLGRNPDVAAVRLLSPEAVVRASSLPAEIGQPAGRHGQQVSHEGDVIPATVGGDGASAPLAAHTLQPFVNALTCQRCHDPHLVVLGFLDLDVSVNPHLIGLTAFSTLSGLLGLLYLGAIVGVAAPLIGAVVRRPVQRVVDAMQGVQAGRLDVRLAPSGTREIDAVIEGFNGMVDQLRQGRAAEEEARRLQLERVEQLAAVGELAAGLAHEIRNPLSGVKAVVEVLAQDASGDETRRAVLRDAAGELSRIDQIVRDLLLYARPRVPSVSMFDLNALARDAATLTLAPAVSKGAALTLDLAPQAAHALGDPEMVRQVLVNLLLNAQQAAVAPDQLHVTVATGERDGTVWCRVRDNGPGVPGDRADSIFRPFVTTKTRGTGLGLSISRRLIEVQGGRLTLDNPGAPGASFTVSIPALPLEPASATP